MIFTKFRENRLIIDEEIKEKHALLVSCGPGFIVLAYGMPWYSVVLALMCL